MEIHQIVEQLRQLFEEFELQTYAKINDVKLIQIYSSFDALEDCQEGIDFYLQSSDTDKVGEKYLRIYGLLQILYVQQDALNNICEALKLSISHKDDENLKKIRHIRNLSVGHPTKKETGKTVSHNFISRNSLSKEFFEIRSYDASDVQFLKNDVLELIDQHQRGIAKLLQNTKQEIKNLKIELKREYQKLPLSNAFSQTVDYDLRKISIFFSQIEKANPPDPPEAHFKFILDSLDKLNKILEEKGYQIDTFEGIKELYDEVEFPLNELRSFFDSRNYLKCNIAEIKAMKYFYFFVRAKIEELISLVKEIDGDLSL